jgi:hypothetical protein
VLNVIGLVFGVKGAISGSDLDAPVPRLQNARNDGGPGALNDVWPLTTKVTSPAT